MPIEDDLLNEIRGVLGNAVMPNHTEESAVSDLYELYVFSLVIEAARAEGADVSYRDVHGNEPGQFVFRTSPGEISSTAHPYVHAVITFPGKPVLECHIGIYVAGQSDVAHECDVAVLHQSEAQTCRQDPHLVPRHPKVLIAAECKYYTTGMKLGLGRGFLGLVSDIQYYYGERYFVINTSPDSVLKLLAKHKKKWGRDLDPNHPNEVNKLRSSFQEVFTSFKVRE